MNFGRLLLSDPDVRYDAIERRGLVDISWRIVVLRSKVVFPKIASFLYTQRLSDVRAAPGMRR